MPEIKLFVLVWHVVGQRKFSVPPDCDSGSLLETSGVEMHRHVRSQPQGVLYGGRTIVCHLRLLAFFNWTTRSANVFADAILYHV